MDTPTFIQATIGPSFLGELTAAGLRGAPISWTLTGVAADTALTAAQLKTLRAVVKAHNPERPAILDDVERVSAVQAKIQLSRMKVGETNLLAMTENTVAKSGDVELQLWFNGARDWVITNPNVQKIGGAFDLEPEEIQAAFNAASEIEE